MIESEGGLVLLTLLGIIFSTLFILFVSYPELDMLRGLSASKYLGFESTQKFQEALFALFLLPILLWSVRKGTKGLRNTRREAITSSSQSFWLLALLVSSLWLQFCLDFSEAFYVALPIAVGATVSIVKGAWAKTVSTLIVASLYTSISWYVHALPQTVFWVAENVADFRWLISFTVGVAFLLDCGLETRVRYQQREVVEQEMLDQELSAGSFVGDGGLILWIRSISTLSLGIFRAYGAWTKTTLDIFGEVVLSKLEQIFIHSKTARASVSTSLLIVLCSLYAFGVTFGVTFLYGYVTAEHTSWSLFFTDGLKVLGGITLFATAPIALIIPLAVRWEASHESIQKSPAGAVVGVNINAAAVAYIPFLIGYGFKYWVNYLPESNLGDPGLVFSTASVLLLIAVAVAVITAVNETISLSRLVKRKKGPFVIQVDMSAHETCISLFLEKTAVRRFAIPGGTKLLDTYIGNYIDDKFNVEMDHSFCGEIRKDLGKATTDDMIKMRDIALNNGETIALDSDMIFEALELPILEIANQVKSLYNELQASESKEVTVVFTESTRGTLEELDQFFEEKTGLRVEPDIETH